MSHLPPGLTEVWIEYAVGVLVFLIRIYTRVSQRGRRWQGDDYLAVLALIFFTVHSYAQHVIGTHGLNVNKDVDRVRSKLPGGKANLDYGSKHNLVAWYSYVGLLWSLKTCMLFLYRRLFDGVWNPKIRIILFTGILLGVTFIISLIVISTNCVPFRLNWQVDPYPGICVLEFNIFYGVGVTNMLTDSVLLCIPIPLLWKAHMSRPKKTFVSVLLCGGIFTMTATFLRTYFGLWTDYDLLRHPRLKMKANHVVLGWAMRECTIAVVVVNAPMIVPFFRLSTWRDRFKKRSRNGLMDFQPNSDSSDSNPAIRVSGLTTRILADIEQQLSMDDNLTNSVARTSTDGKAWSVCGSKDLSALSPSRPDAVYRPETLPMLA